MIQNRALGKGLSALIPPKESEYATQEKILQIPTSQIRPSKYQPRLEFSKEGLDDLMNSIREKGVVQPILVRKAQDGYELIAGERRLRAVKNLGVANIPAIVKDVGDVDMLEMALIENIQREELNAMEEAHAFQRFITDFNFTQEKIAKALGKDRSTIANTIRLLGLPAKIRGYISKGAITAGHARALLALPTESEQLRACSLIIKKGLSVREAENLANKRSLGAGKASARLDPHVSDVEERLQRTLGTRVRITHGKKRGTVHIDYYSSDDLNRIIGILEKRGA